MYFIMPWQKKQHGSQILYKQKLYVHISIATAHTTTASEKRKNPHRTAPILLSYGDSVMQFCQTPSKKKVQYLLLITEPLFKKKS